MMDKIYDPKSVEEKWLKYWEDAQLYSPSTLKEGRENFSILLPPPNANASLHAGHAMFVVQDILMRYHRMKGDNAVWIPGTDHAGFETQYVFEKQLAKEGKSRFNFNRKDLYDAVYNFVQDNSGLIEEQLKKLGFSLDWSRKTFTLDSHVVRTVYDTFEKMYKDDLIYRDDYIVNYCTHCGTSFSELEVEYKDKVDPLVYFKYGPFVLATVRPETKFGDTAIAVNPNDDRYKEWVGKEIEAEGLLGKFKIKVIADEFVDPEFGTGVVKVTPAHDPNDFQIGRRHGLEVRQVIDLQGRLNDRTGPYAGLKVNEARKRVLEDMKSRGMIDHIDENYSHRVSTCYKCGRDIEPMVLPNWFLKMKPLAEKAVEAAKKKEVVFYPARFEDEFYRWLENIRDWPISRQIVWGIRIPAWYDIAKNPNLLVTFLNLKGETVFGKIDELMRDVVEGGGGYAFDEIKKGLQNLTADNTAIFEIAADEPTDGNYYLPETDTFDTWFSSGQWPLVTLHYPEGEDYKKFYPTTVMDTMWDILFFWVARMIMFGIYLTGNVPFKTVLLHSRVVDEKGQKMSKSKGNVVNPLDLTNKYGTDALRISLISGSALGNDVPLYDGKVKGFRNFANKMWNSARFVLDFKGEGIIGLEKISGIDGKTVFTPNWNRSLEKALTYAKSLPNVKEVRFAESNSDETHGEKVYANFHYDILEELGDLKTLVTESIEKYRFSDAAVALYEFYWHIFCDRYIEFAKDNREASQPVLEFVLKASMEMLHPFMPFVTEEIWQRVPHTGKSISISD